MYSRRDFIDDIRKYATITPVLHTHIFLTGVAFHEEDLSRLQLQGAVLDGCTFEKCNFAKSMLQGVSLRHCEFDNCSFDGADSGTGIHVVGATFRNGDLVNLHGDWRFTDCVFDLCAFARVHRASIVFDDETRLTACDVAEVAPNDNHDALSRLHFGLHFTSWNGDQAAAGDDEDDKNSIYSQ